MTNLKKILKASYKNQKEARNDLENLGYKYDNDLSSNDAKVFSDANGKPHIVHRGTHKMRLKDLKSDIMLGLGLQKYDNRFKEAKHTTQLVRDKYNQEPDVFGHSLGGDLAKKSGSKGNITTYNKGAGLGDIGKTIPKNQTDIRTTRDPVSIISNLQKYNGNLKEIQSPQTQGLLEAHNLNNL
jgi:hypothetical protein